MGIVLGKNARRTFRRGDFVCSLQYVNKEESACFFPAPHVRRQGAAAFVIGLSVLHRYVDERHLMKQAKLACELMHMDQTRGTVVALAKFMSDMLPELQHMEPDPGDSIDEIVRRERVERVDLGPNSAHIVVGPQA